MEHTSNSDKTEEPLVQQEKKIQTTFKPLQRGMKLNIISSLKEEAVMKILLISKTNQYHQ